MLYNEYKKSPLVHILSFEDFKNFRGFMSLKSLESEFCKKVEKNNQLSLDI